MKQEHNPNTIRQQVYSVVETSSFLRDSERELLAETLSACDRLEKAENMIIEQTKKKNSYIHEISLPKEILAAEEKAQESLAPLCSKLNSLLKNLRQQWSKTVGQSSMDTFFHRINVFRTAYMNRLISDRRQEISELNETNIRLKAEKSIRLSQLAVADSFSKHLSGEFSSGQESSLPRPKGTFAEQVVRAYGWHLKEKQLQMELTKIKHHLNYRSEKAAQMIIESPTNARAS